MAAKRKSGRGHRPAAEAAQRDAWCTHELSVEADAFGGPALADREWLLTNGTGAFAMGTAAGVNARRYHGLLIAATHPPVGRILAINQMFERLALRPAGSAAAMENGPESEAARVLEFTTCHFRDGAGQDVFSPRGFAHQVQFRRGLTVTWTYHAEGIEFARTLRLHWKEQAITLSYRIRGLAAAGLEATLYLSPMMTLRDFHGTTRRQWTPPYIIRGDQDTATVAQGKVAVTLRCGGARFARSDEWWYNLFYRCEEERGADAREDYFLPGWFESSLGAKDEAEVMFTAVLGKHPVAPATGPDPRRAHLEPIVEHLNTPSGTGREMLAPPVRRQMAIATDDFIVDRTIAGQKLSTIIAGYPWFADWGRDTFIALPGLLLETGRYEEARATLQTFARALRNGLVPNRFDDYDDSAAHYNTVDASLWFIHAAMRYVQTSGDTESWNDWLAEACGRIITAYSKGTENNIRACEDGLIAAGDAGTQLTWMDAKTHGVIFTPRFGKPVEINALWYHALRGMGRMMAPNDAAAAERYNRMAAQVAESFVPCFWNEHLGFLNDTVCPDEAGHWRPDGSLRPNQIFAAALPDSPLPDDLRRKVVEVVGHRLLTPFGLRTLPVDDHRYHGKYLGDQFHRDKAYHQGTVWPWLFGIYTDAALFCAENIGEKSREIEKMLLTMLEKHLYNEGTGFVSEVFDGENPAAGKGAFAQAWSSAEIIRALYIAGINKNTRTDNRTDNQKADKNEQ